VAATIMSDYRKDFPNAIPQEYALPVDDVMIDGRRTCFDTRYKCKPLGLFHGVTTPYYHPWTQMMHKAANEPGK
jgi:hypothetical protein